MDTPVILDDNDLPAAQTQRHKYYYSQDLKNTAHSCGVVVTDFGIMWSICGALYTC